LAQIHVPDSDAVFKLAVEADLSRAANVKPGVSMP
jgi:hypothetical protein